MVRSASKSRLLSGRLRAGLSVGRKAFPEKPGLSSGMHDILELQHRCDELRRLSPDVYASDPVVYSFPVPAYLHDHRSPSIPPAPGCPAGTYLPGILQPLLFCNPWGLLICRLCILAAVSQILEAAVAVCGHHASVPGPGMAGISRYLHKNSGTGFQQRRTGLPEPAEHGHPSSPSWEVSGDHQQRTVRRFSAAVCTPDCHCLSGSENFSGSPDPAQNGAEKSFRNKGFFRPSGDCRRSGNHSRRHQSVYCADRTDRPLSGGPLHFLHFPGRVRSVYRSAVSVIFPAFLARRRRKSRLAAPAAADGRSMAHRNHKLPVSVQER